MVGVIRKRDVLAHPLVTIQCFGWRVFVKTMVAGGNQTFLALLMDSDFLGVKRMDGPEIVARSIQLELRAAEIYERLAERFSGNGEARDFFAQLVEDEKEHAELLRLCSASARMRWKSGHLQHWAGTVPRLEERMREVESSLDEVDDLTEALRLVVEIEGSEVNRVFQGIVSAVDSAFVRALAPFHVATRTHLEFVRRRIAEMEPGLASLCKVLAPKRRLGAEAN